MKNKERKRHPGEDPDGEGLSPVDAAAASTIRQLKPDASIEAQLAM